MKFFLMVIFLATLVGCSGNKEYVGYAPTRAEIERQELVNEIRAKVAAEEALEKLNAEQATALEEPTVSDDTEVSSVEVAKDVVWEDLRIQKLLPGFMIVPAIEPYLPTNFVALRNPNAWNKVYWGDKKVLEVFFEKGISALKSAVICVDISLNVAQIDENSFSDAGSDSDLLALGIKNTISNHWKWGPHPVMSLSAMMGDREFHVAWIGLNQGGQVLYAAPIYPPSHNALSEEESSMWSEFLKKTTPLKEYEFYKVHGQDLREGVTLVNVYGSVLRVSAEKRKRDDKIQVIIMPQDNTISCKCLDVVQTVMGASWRFLEPILKIQSEIQVSNDANIVSQNVITVFIKEVSEFSNNEEDLNSKSLSLSKYDNVSIFNLHE